LQCLELRINLLYRIEEVSTFKNLLNRLLSRTSPNLFISNFAFLFFKGEVFLFLVFIIIFTLIALYGRKLRFIPTLLTHFNHTFVIFIVLVVGCSNKDLIAIGIFILVFIIFLYQNIFAYVLVFLATVLK
jgi:hypothetical protein